MRFVGHGTGQAMGHGPATGHHTCQGQVGKGMALSHVPCPMSHGPACLPLPSPDELSITFLCVPDTFFMRSGPVLLLRETRETRDETLIMHLWALSQTLLPANLRFACVPLRSGYVLDAFRAGGALGGCSCSCSITPSVESEAPAS